MSDFFISYAEPDREWAAWVAWQLQEEGYQVTLQDWDFSPGSNFVVNMQKAVTQSDRVVAILSHRYINRSFPQAEWSAAFANDPTGEERRLLPVRIEDFRPTGLFKSIVYIDLVNRQEGEAKEALLSGVKRAINGRPSLSSAPRFPGTVSREIQSQPQFPGGKLGGKGKAANGFRRFVHSRVASDGVLDASVLANPYREFFDPTDSYAEEFSRDVDCFLWLPRTEVIRSQLEPLTPTVAICSVDTEAALTRLKFLLGAEISALSYPPRRLRNEEKLSLFPAIGDALKGCFVFAVIFPNLVLGLERSRPEISYQAMVNLLFLPLLGMHKRLGFQCVHANFVSVGEKDALLLQLAKKAAKGCFQKKESVKVSLIGDDPGSDMMGKIARLFAWAVGHYYNSGDKKWLIELEESFCD